MADVAALVDQMWTELMATSKSGEWFHRGGEVAPGHWLAAKKLRDQIKAAVAPAPTVAITSPTANATVTGKITVTGTSS